MTERTIPNAAILSGWRKSSYSSGDGGSCVEVLDGHPSGVPVRDSKAPQGPALVFSSGAWSSFMTAMKADIRVLGFRN
ncbi:DUF397 domain-containing protein [Streptomyces fradiae]|uniref:DUF397 domain-containing protein n=1 Tax=Streptomyces rubrolavendulae TaxID=285473 RepID=A0A1D8G0M4_9ACTN|nr:DUF397 domain-containing protein [Streptomyces rubrolavendulae]AOT58992.1 hypothetical protein A4G23_01817 [Streptomyces rubrolavendulae]